MTAAWMLRRVRREAGRRPGVPIALAAAFAALALVGGAAVLGARASATLLPLVEQNVHVIAYLDERAGPDERKRLLATLRRLPGVHGARAVEPDEALARLRAAASSVGDASALTAVEPTFLPRSIEIALAPGGDLGDRAAELAARLRQVPGVAEVDAMTEGLARLHAWRTLGAWVLRVAIALALAAALAALGLAVARGRAARRLQAEVLALLGETPSGIRRPAALVSTAAALVGTLVGLGALAALFPRALDALATTVGLAQPAAASFLSAREIAIALAAAAVAGWIAGRASAPQPETPRA